DIFVVEVEVGREHAEFFGGGQAGVRVFRGDARQSERALEHLLESLGRKIGAVGGAHALSEEDAHAHGARAGFLQRLDFVHANDGGELVALVNHGLGGRGAGAHGAGDGGGGKLLEISSHTDQLHT